MYEVGLALRILQRTDELMHMHSNDILQYSSSAALSTHHSPIYIIYEDLCIDMCAYPIVDILRLLGT